MTTGGAPLTRRRTLALGGAALGVGTLGGASLVRAQYGSGSDGSGNGPDDGSGADTDGNGGNDADGDSRQYRVTVANLTPGQPFTPPAVAVHRSDVEVFSVGDSANTAVQQVAENGNLGPLLDLIGSTDAIRDAAVGDSPLVPADDPGDTGNPYYATLHLSADASATHLTFISMLIATNDGFVGLDTVPLPKAVNESRTYYANGYDAGTERNTERFADLVPPAQSLIQGGDPEGGTAQSDPALAEGGVIRPHPGIRGDGDLSPSVYGWREPVGVVQVERLDGLQREFSATLTGDAEVPPIETDASGEATFSLDPSGELSYEVTVSDIENVVAAHIHCGAVGTNGPVGVTLFSGDPVSPDGVLAEGTVAGPDDGNGCGWESLDDVVSALRGDGTYVNVHTEANPAGEIRGQVR